MSFGSVFPVAGIVLTASVVQAGNIRVSTTTYLSGAANEAAAGVGIGVDRSVLVMAACSSAK